MLSSGLVLSGGGGAVQEVVLSRGDGAVQEDGAVQGGWCCPGAAVQGVVLSRVLQYGSE